MTDHLQAVLELARSLPTEELPRLLGELREVEATALARLTAPRPAEQTPDTLLNIDEAASRLAVSRSFLYRNSGKLPFTRHVGAKLLFSATEIARYIKVRR
jgi:excisionase family DNA binding protein